MPFDGRRFAHEAAVDARFEGGGRKPALVEKERHVSLLTDVPTPPMDLERFRGIATRTQLDQALAMAADLRDKLANRVVWNVSSTAAGGGVAEMLHRLIGYARGVGFDSRWLVLRGNPEFFQITKRLHNALHGDAQDGVELDDSAHEKYRATLRPIGEELRARVSRGDLVFLHDPQTAGLVPDLAGCGAAIVWRCHIGNGNTEHSVEEQAWEFLRRYLEKITCCVFTRVQYVPAYLQPKSVVITPNIDPFAPKNEPMSSATVRAILTHIGVTSGPRGRGKRVFLRSDGTRMRIERTASIVRMGDAPTEQTPLVVQVSRWDRLKDPLGVMRGFECFARRPGAPMAELMLVGPQSEAVADDPEGAEVFREVVHQWEVLPEAVRRRVHLVSLPMDDMEENAAMVNAIQRHASIVVQKSLREGFGLTVTEAMWKARPVVGSAVGGIQDQIEHQRSGVLVPPTSDKDFADALLWLFADPERAKQIGRRAKARVKREYLGVRSLLCWGALISKLLAASNGSGRFDS
jgi:trehalose synthase